MPVTPTATKVQRGILLSFSLVAVILGSGCSGINASRSFSPLDFLIPGGLFHMQNAPEKSILPEATNSIVSLAQAR
jgi:hypothetical protein